MSTSTSTTPPIPPTSPVASDTYHPQLPPLTPAFTALLTNYAQIPPSSHTTHLTSLRNRAYVTHPYPCLGRWRFLSLDLSTHPQYATVLALVGGGGGGGGKGATFLDLGCCLGQDVRKLAYDLLSTSSLSTAPTNSAPTTTANTATAATAANDIPSYASNAPLYNLYAADLLPAFIATGYLLFRDEAILPPTQFLGGADVFDDSETNVLRALDGRVGVLSVTAVFHLFDWEAQVRVAGRVLRLLARGSGSGRGEERESESGREGGAEGDGDGKKEGQGQPENRALVLGCQVGNSPGGQVGRSSGTGTVFRQDAESWRRLWEEVAGSDEWRGVVRGVEVHSELRRPREDMKSRWGEEMRWHVWWVWVDFF